MLKTVFALLILASVARTQKIDRSKPPETPPVPTYKLPPVSESKLPNGLTVVLVEDGRFPFVTVRLAFQAGSKFDPEDLPGLSESTGNLLREGTKNRTSRQIAEELASIGGSIDVQHSRDTLVIAGSSLAENTVKFLDLVADVVRNATFPADEVELHKTNRKQSLLEQRSMANFQADEKFNALIFGNHPYARIHPTLESIDRLDTAKLAAFRNHYLVPNQAVLIVLGKLPPRDELLKVLEAKFGAWEQKEAPAPPQPKFPESKRQLALVDRPGSVQADIRVGRIAVTRLDPDHFPLVVGNTILGGGASSRLFMNVREKKGYAYQANTFLQRFKDSGYFAAVTQVRNDVVQPALEAVLEELDSMAKTPVSAAELSNAKNFLSGTFVMSLESQGGVASQLALVRTMGLPNDYLETYTTHVRAVEPDQIQAAAKKYMAPDRAAIVVVGDAEKISKPLGKFGEFEVTKAK